MAVIVVTNRMVLGASSMGNMHVSVRILFQFICHFLECYLLACHDLITNLNH